MEQSVQPEDREPSEDKGHLYADTNVGGPTEYNQVSDPRPERPDIDDDDFRPRVPAIITKQEPHQTLLRSHHPDHVSASNLPQDDAPMLPETARMIVDSSRADASEDQDAELARIQLEDRSLRQDVALTARETEQSADGEPIKNKGDLSPDNTNVKAPTELYQAHDPLERLEELQKLEGLEDEGHPNCKVLRKWKKLVEEDHPEEITFPDIDRDRSGQFNDDEPFDEMNLPESGDGQPCEDKDDLSSDDTNEKAPQNSIRRRILPQRLSTTMTVS
jgi:hypothetical protein